MLLAVAAALLVTTQAFAATGPTIASKQAEARQVVNEINALNVSLDRSDELMNLANLKLANVRQEHRDRTAASSSSRSTTCVESRRTIASRLVNLYASGSTSTLDVILGGQNVGDILNRIDTADRVSSIEAQVANQVVTFKRAVLRNRSRAGAREDPGRAARGRARRTSSRRSRCGSASGGRSSARSTARSSS